MKFRNTMVAWNPGTDQVRAGPLVGEHSPDWSRHPIDYRMTGGAVYSMIQRSDNKAFRDLMMFVTFHTIVVRDRVPLEAAHRAFLEIDEYRARISPDIQGADPGGTEI